MGVVPKTRWACRARKRHLRKTWNLSSSKTVSEADELVRREKKDDAEETRSNLGFDPSIGNVSLRHQNLNRGKK